MALYETLIEGGHEHLIDAVKARIAQKADAIVEDELKPIIENQPSATLEGELLMAEDAADLPPVVVGVDGRSTQVTTTGAQMLNDATSTRGYKTNPNGNLVSGSAYSASNYIAVEASTTYRFANLIGSTYGYSVCEYDENKEFIQYQNIDGGTPVSGSFTMSGTTAYVRVSYSTAQAGAAMMSKGSAAVPYEPYTGGKPSPNPDYPQEIVSLDELALGIAGKNLLPESSCDQWLSVNGWSTSGTQKRKGFFIGVGASATLSFDITKSLEQQSNTSRLYVTGVGTYFDLSGKTGHFEVHGGADADGYMFLSLNANFIRDTERAPYVNNIQLEIGSTATDYEPYEGHTVPLLPDGYSLRSLLNGTKDELHLTYLRPSSRAGWAVYARELVQRVGSIDLGDQTWTTSGTGTAQKYAAIISPPMPYGWLSAAAYMCSAYTTVSSRASSTSMPDDSVGNRATRGDVVYVRDTRFVDEPDPTALKAALSGVRFDYALNASYIQTHTLDPVELPVLPSKHATVWSDPTANLKLTYVIDSETIEESLESGIGKAFSSVAPVETSPATDSHGVGSRIVYNETLYKVTSAIAAGEDIVPGTNVTATTVAAELLATQA